jgi:hypothetical protein
MLIDFNKKYPHPPSMKPQRARVVILDGVRLIAKRCQWCRAEFYGEEKVITCDGCKAVRKRSRR